MSSRASRRDLLLVASASVFWGSAGVVNQAIYIHNATNAFSLAFLRLAIAAPLFLVAAWHVLRRRLWQIKLADAAVMLLMGGLQGLYQMSYSAALPLSGVTISTLIAICVAPILVTLFSVLRLRERLAPLTLIALVCALGGTVLLVVTSPYAGATHVSLLGAGFALLAASGYAGYILCGRLLTGRYHALHINSIAFGTGALFLLSFAPFFKLETTYPVQDWLLLLYLGAIPTALAYGIFQIGMRSLSATVISIVTLCEPLMAAILAWIFFHEALGPLGLLGAALLLGTMMMLLLFPQG